MSLVDQLFFSVAIKLCTIRWGGTLFKRRKQSGEEVLDKLAKTEPKPCERDLDSIIFM